MLATSSVSVINVNDGQDGATIVKNIVEYCIYTSGDVVPGSPLTDSEGNIIYDANGLVLTDGAWSTTMPQASEGDFIWTRSKTVYSDGTFALAYMVSHYGENGERGATGVSVVNVVPEYRLSNSSTALTGTGTGYTWSTKKPSVQSDQYIWERQRNELSDGSVVYSEATCDVVMSGLVFDVDQNKNAITSKVWQTDIESKINQYDDAAGTTIRNRVTKTEQDINGIFSQVLDINTTGEGDQIQYTSQRLSAIEQTAEDITSTVESKYATKAEVGSNNLYVIADQVPGYLHQSNGSIVAQNATGKECTSAYIPVEENESIVIQSWCTPLNQDGTANPGYSWLAYQFFSDDDPVTPIGNRAAKWGYTSGSGVETSADGVEHLTYTVTAPANAKYIRVSYRSYEDGYAMVEKADTSSEYIINPRDLQDYTDTQVTSAKSEIKQTTDAIELTVSSKVGNNEVISKINQSSETIQILASKVNIEGAVTFSSFNTDLQSRITTAEGNASTALSDAATADDKASPSLGMKINHDAFGDSTSGNGECYIHGYTNGVAANVDGYIYWNGVKRTVSKTMLNPNQVLPYYTTIYIVLRLSSASATTGTLYMVWYNSGWKYAITPTPTAVGGTWTWAEATDIVLGQFVEPSSEGPIVDAYLYDPPRNASFIQTTGNNSYQYSKSAVDWVGTNGSSVITAKNILDSWKGEAEAGVTTINGGLIQTHTITANNLATDAIMSSGYTADTSSVYSTVGTFLDLANGNIKSPTFAVDNTNGTAYIDGTISARNLLVGTAAAELSSSGGLLNSSQGALVGNALDSAGDYLIYDGESILIKTDNFSIDPEGNVSMTGKVEAQSGSIGGWEISDDNLHYGSPIGSSGSVYLIPQGSTTWHSVGGSYETNGWVITAGENFGVTKDGALYANDANITGAFTITDGGIGGMTIDSDTISTTTSGMSSNTSKNAFWAGETNGSYGTTSTDAKFKVGHDGKLTASNADITGKITAQSGTIGGWKITSDSLYYYTNDTVPQVGTANSVFLCPEGSSTSKSIGGSPSTTTGWVFTAGTGFGVTRTGAVYASSGRIGGVTLSDCNVYAYNTTATPSFQLLSTGYLAIGGTSGQITVDTNGVLSIPAARITGQLTAGQIETGALTVTQLAGFDVDDDTITDNSITMSTANFTKTINGTSYTNLRFAIGSYFGVSNTGALYSCSGKIGGFNIGTYYLYSVATTNGSIGSDGSIYLGSVNLPSAQVAGVNMSTWRLTVGAYFGVTGSGQLYCTRGQIGGLTILGDRLYNGSIGEDGSIFVGASNLGYGTVADYYTNKWRFTVGENFGITGSTVYGKRIRILNTSATRWNFTSDDTDYTFTVKNEHPTDSTKRTTLKIGAAGEAGMMIKNNSSYLGGFIVTNGNEMGIINWTNASNPSWPFRYSFSNSSSYITGTNVYINGSPYTSSDERIKTIHRTLNDDHKKLFMSLKPIEYSFVDRPGERHFGLGAQTTESSMNELGFGEEYGMVNHSVNSHKDQYGMDESYYLNYTEALMLSVPVVQDHEKEIAKLKVKIEELENKLSQLTQ